MKYLAYLIPTYLLGYLVFFTSSLFVMNEGWDRAYFIWSSLSHGGFLCWLCIWKCAPISIRKDIRPVTGVSFFISLWEIICMVTQIDVNNKWGVAALFLALISVLSYYMFKGFNKLNNYICNE